MNINRIIQVGNLTKDPELKTFGETTVCKMRLAVNDRVKVNGEWTDKPMYFDVDAFGKLAEICAQYLKRGSRIMYEGKAKWREWETDAGEKRQAVSFVADNVVLPTKREAEQGGGAYAGSATNAAPSATNAAPQQDFNRGNFDPATDPDFQESTGDDDIPF